MAERLVVDACVAAKWFLNDEDDVDLAENILACFLVGDIELYAPRSFTYEVCGLISKACRLRTTTGPRISRDDAVDAVKRFSQILLNIQEFDFNRCLRR